MNELKPEDVMRALAWYEIVGKNIGSVTIPYDELQAIAALLREKDAEIERLTKDRDEARRDCAVAEQNHYECKKELETARAEAITEFADRLIKKCDAPHWCVWMSEIDDWEEKMKGELDEN